MTFASQLLDLIHDDQACINICLETLEGLSDTSLTADLLSRLHIVADIALNRSRRNETGTQYVLDSYVSLYLCIRRVKSIERMLKILKLIPEAGAVLRLRTLTFSDFHIVCRLIIECNRELCSLSAIKGECTVHAIDGVK